MDQALLKSECDRLWKEHGCERVSLTTLIMGKSAGGTIEQRLASPEDLNTKDQQQHE